MRGGPLARFARLPGAFNLVVRAWLALAHVDYCLRRHGYQRCLAAYSSPGETRVRTADVGIRAARYVSAIERAARCYPGTAVCLQQSLVLHRWLQRDGVPTDLRIGVLRHNRDFRAHAWVELDGQVLNDRVAAVRQFTPLRSAA
jgi:hypothetical protein